MKRVVSLFGCIFLIVVVLQLTGITGAWADPCGSGETGDCVGTITLPSGNWDVTATATAKEAADTLDFGLKPITTEGNLVCSDCQGAGETKTFPDLSGEVVFQLRDDSAEGMPTFDSNGDHAHVDQTDDTHWTIYWDDAGGDGDFNDLVTSVVATQPADLSVTKTDSPDPVSSGGEIQYTVTATNNGPYDATGVTITDTLPAGTTFKANASCPNSSQNGNVVTCPIGPLANGASSTVFIVVTAPTVSTQTTITDTATVSGDQPDPGPGLNTATETTTVNPSSTADFATGFYDGVNPLDIQTSFGPKDSMRSEIKVPSPSGTDPYQARTVTDTEVPAKSNPTFCGGSICDAQLDVSVLPTGSQPDSPIQVILYFKDDAVNGDAVYAQGDAPGSTPHLLAKCDSPTVARVGGVPSKCVASITIIKVGKDRVKKVVVNVDSSSDPTITKK